MFWRAQKPENPELSKTQESHPFIIYPDTVLERSRGEG